LFSPNPMDHFHAVLHGLTTRSVSSIASGDVPPRWDPILASFPHLLRRPQPSPPCSRRAPSFQWFLIKISCFPPLSTCYPPLHPTNHPVEGPSPPAWPFSSPTCSGSFPLSIVVPLADLTYFQVRLFIYLFLIFFLELEAGHPLFPFTRVLFSFHSGHKVHAAAALVFLL